ncbi:MAG: hypothetical protein NVS4B2_30220 [Chloroflexota bacterium]
MAALRSRTLPPLPFRYDRNDDLTREGVETLGHQTVECLQGNILLPGVVKALLWLLRTVAPRRDLLACDRSGRSDASTLYQWQQVLGWLP